MEIMSNITKLIYEVIQLVFLLITHIFFLFIYDRFNTIYTYQKNYNSKTGAIILQQMSHYCVVLASNKFANSWDVQQKKKQK
jgi:hypothetical protein